MVYCKECKYYCSFEAWDRDSQEMIQCHECTRLHTDGGYAIDFGEDGYCCLGERKDNE